MNSLPKSFPGVSRYEAAKELLRRRQARSSLQEFIRYINPEYVVSDFSLTVCAALDSFLSDMVAGKRPVLVLAAPPQHGKTEIVSRNFPAYVFGKYPDWALGGLSYGASLAIDINRDVQRIMMGDEYRILFPGSSLNAKRVVNIEVEAKRNSETFEIVGRRGSYVAQGVGGPLTGRRLVLGIIDDPIKNAQEALSQTTKESTWNWYTSTFLTRLSKNSGQIIMATRWALDDLSGRVLDNNSAAKNLVFPAINDAGEALVPELHPIDKLRDTEKMLGPYFWSAMYMQRPTPMSGGMFKPGNIEIVDALPAELKFVRGWDLAASKNAGDWTVGVKLAVIDGVIYIADLVRERGSPDEIERLVVNTSAVDGRRVFQSLPQDPGQAGKAQVAYLSKRMPGRSFEFTTETGDKATRASPFAAQVNAGNVKMIRADWNDALIHELRSFPTGHHDDIVDAASRAYNRVSQRRISIAEML